MYAAVVSMRFYSGALCETVLSWYLGIFFDYNMLLLSLSLSAYVLFVLCFFMSLSIFYLRSKFTTMSDAVVIKQEPVDDARLLSVTSANLEVCIGDDVKMEECDESYLKHFKQEPVDFVVPNVADHDVC